MSHTLVLGTSDWCISGCIPGYAGTTTCTQCPVNTYSPGHLAECVSCGELSETDGPGATSAEDCSKFFFQFWRILVLFWSYGYPLWTFALARVEPLTCVLHYLRILDSSDSALVWHQLTYWQIVWQMSSFLHLLFQTLVGVEHVLECSTDRSLKRVSYCRSRSADWNK